MIGLLLFAGFVRSLQFTSINAIAYADVPDKMLSRATTFAAVGQELSGSIGVSVAALGLEMTGRIMGRDPLALANFPPVFVMIGLLAATSSFFLWRTLPDGAGANLVGRRKDLAAAED